MLDITNTTRTAYPTSIPYQAIKDSVLGTDYELSVVFCGRHLMRRLNRETRNKDYPTDVLSFPLSEHSGELFICPDVCHFRAREHQRSYPNYLAMLFVHGMVHLKGHDHGATMDRLETRYRKQFGI